MDVKRGRRRLRGISLSAHQGCFKEHHRFPPVAVEFGETVVHLVRVHHRSMDHPTEPFEELLEFLVSSFVHHASFESFMLHESGLSLGCDPALDRALGVV